jgi:hypothetical protein
MLMLDCATEKTSIPTYASVESATDRQYGKEIFAMGIEDKSDDEFCSSGFCSSPSILSGDRANSPILFSVD